MCLYYRDAISPMVTGWAQWGWDDNTYLLHPNATLRKARAVAYMNARSFCRFSLVSTRFISVSLVPQGARILHHQSVVLVHSHKKPYIDIRLIVLRPHLERTRTDLFFRCCKDFPLWYPSKASCPKRWETSSQAHSLLNRFHPLYTRRTGSLTPTSGTRCFRPSSYRTWDWSPEPL